MTDQLQLLKAALADQYAVERVLGQGGSAVVYLARDIALDQAVAIKVLRPEFAESVSAERFSREIRLAAQLQHPRIVPITTSGVAAGFVYFVLPYVRGESLRELLGRTPQLEVAEAVRLTRQIADGLAFAHSKDIIHRDIKPENILLSDGNAVITDFGLAKARAEAGRAGSSTDSGIAVGTPRYMSPEQASASKSIDARTDQYSLACVCYEMLAGEPPFSGPTPQAVAMRHLNQAPPPIRIVRPGVSPSLAAVLERALAKVPADRYRTVAEFSAALEDALVNPSVRVPLLARPGARPVAVSLVVVVAALLGWQAWTSIKSQRGVTVASRAEAQEPPRIAVLSFEPPSPELAAFASSLTNRLTDALASTDPAVFTVAPRSAIAPYEKRNTPLAGITGALNIATLVHGNIETQSGQLRINVRLLDGKTNNTLATHYVSARVPNGPALVDAVADTVLHALSRMLGPEIKKRWQALGTSSTDAFDSVQVAELRLASFDSLLGVPDLRGARRQVEAADSLFGASARLDPQWAEPVVGRGKLVYQRLQLAIAEKATDAAKAQLIRDGLRYAERAVKLAPDDRQALQLRGSLRYMTWVNDRPVSDAQADALRDSARADLLRALDGNPNRSKVLLTLSELSARSGQLDDALKYARQAYTSDPFLARTEESVLRLFDYSFELQQDSAAARWCDEGAHRFPERPYFYNCQLQLMAWSSLSRPDPARARSLKAKVLSHYNAPMSASLEPSLELLVGIVHAKAGERDSARAKVNRALAVSPLPYGKLVPASNILFLLGDKDAAVSRVVTYAAEHPDMRDKMLHARGLSALRQDPRVMHALEPPQQR